MTRPILIVCAIVLSLVATGRPGHASANASVYVDSATEGWTSSGLYLEAGQTAWLSAWGSALCNALIQTICVTDPNGAQTAWETFVFPGVPAYGLLASVGGSGPIFVGTGPYQLNGPGEVVLLYNDEYYPDNIGGYTVEISVVTAGDSNDQGDGGSGNEGNGGDDQSDGGDSGDGGNPGDGDGTGGDPYQAPPYSATVLPPIDSDGSSVFTAKRGNVPVKFSVLVDGEKVCDLPHAAIGVTRVAGANVGPVSPDDFGSSSDSGTSYRITNGGCQYHYNLRAANLGPGSYEVAVYIDGVKVGSAFFTLE